ncbi:MAG: cysteine--tRNA ligase [Chitinispirillaceae bacterium]|nr:cysteine--tRNA ligase [Chitinispirillaceae bacterium]
MNKNFCIYNTASRSKEKFESVHDIVGMYCCGPTVYNYAHIGNLRTYLFEDVLRRALVSLGYTVKHVVNITDVGHLVSDADTGEDKMEKGAKREGRSVWEIAEFYTKKFMENIRDLNILVPDVMPKATVHIPQMVAMVRELERRGFTYRTGDGIYYDTSKFPSYAAFARLDPDSIRAGERVDIGEKRSPTDFALWKFSPAGAKRQMEWESPWGVGFPGWHIECSAMALAHLPQPVEIHCGGTDHVRIHHTNEIAQAEGATGKPFVRYWLHGEFLVIDKGKMAKSGENFVTLDSLAAEKMPALAYRMFCFSAHYRSPLAFSWEGLRGAAAALANLRRSLAGLSAASPGKGAAESSADPERVEGMLDKFYAAVCDDLNMPQAMAALWDIVRDEKTSAALRRAAAARADEILCLDLLKSADREASESFAGEKGTVIRLVAGRALAGAEKEAVVDKVRRRQRARAEKDWKGADTLRKELSDLGAAVKDLPDGTAEITLE